MRIPIAYALGWPGAARHPRTRARSLRPLGPGVRAARSRALPGPAAGPARLAAGWGGTYSIECRQRGGGGGVPGGRIGFLDIARTVGQVLERAGRRSLVMISRPFSPTMPRLAG